ncbi:MAG: sulfatase-like hydrolase/transferase [Opitutaceae bacterium]|nr:sulfatase-like hydrolase/transferase [Opitutaceae bacterium]MBP9913373.1 sulfatase-like hydrolase/transferase [Opitutaceae bacterium]
MKPNILLITTDQQRWDTLGINGNRVIQTAHLDHLAATGTNFTRAYSTTPSCIAARRTLLTGQHAVKHGMTGYQDGVEFHPAYTLPGLLGDAGYQTQLIGKLHQFPQRKRYGFDHLILSEMIDYRPGSPVVGENDYVDWLRDAIGGNVDPNLHGIGSNSRLARPFHLEESYHHTTWVVQEAAKFLTQKRDPASPWFLHLSFWAPHPPLVPPQFYYDFYTRRSERWSPTLGEWSPRGTQTPGNPPDSNTGPYDLETMRNAMAGYYGLIHHVDDALNFLLGRSFIHGTAAAQQPTWILFTSDHGELLGDHQLFRKVLPYEGSTHVPLFVSSRNLQLPAQASDQLACLEDVCPTILDMAGIAVPDGVDGQSLLPVIQGRSQSTGHKVLYGEHSGAQANHWIIQDHLKYIWYAPTHEEQLFDLAADPGETKDLSADSAKLAPFRELLAARLQDRTDYTYTVAQLKPCANGQPAVFWP